MDGTITNKRFGNDTKHKAKVCRDEYFIISQGQNRPQNCGQGREGSLQRPCLQLAEALPPGNARFLSCRVSPVLGAARTSLRVCAGPKKGGMPQPRRVWGRCELKPG